MTDTKPTHLPPEAAAEIAAMRQSFEQRLRTHRNRIAVVVTANVVVAAFALAHTLRAGTATLEPTALRAQVAAIAREEAANAIAGNAFVQQAFRGVQERAADAFERVGALREQVEQARQRVADVERDTAAAVARTTALEAQARELDAVRATQQQQLADASSRTRELAAALERMQHALAALRNSETGQLAQHVQALAQLVEEHGSLADVQVLATAVRAGTFAQLDCRALTIRRADGTVLAEARGDALTFRDRRGEPACTVRVADDEVAVVVGGPGDGPQCRIESSGVGVSQARANGGERIRAASLTIAGGDGVLALAGVGAATAADVLPPRVALDRRQLVFHDGGVPIVRIGREQDGTGGVRVMGPGAEPGQQRGALLAPAALESWEHEHGARRTAIRTGDQVRIGFGDRVLRRGSNGVELATEHQLGGDVASALATIQR
jgi:hypothetical protein